MAKSSGFNLSREFEEWLKIRLNKMDKEESNNEEDADLIIARYRAEIMKLESQKQKKVNEDMQKKEEDMVIDGAIDNLIEYYNKRKHGEKDGNLRPGRAFEWNEQILSKATGIVFLFKKKFDKRLDIQDAKTIIENRLKDKNIDITK